MSEQPTKTKKPRRSDAAVAADYARRAESARIRYLRKGPQWQRLTAAIEALGNLTDGERGEEGDGVVEQLTGMRDLLEGVAARVTVQG